MQDIFNLFRAIYDIILAAWNFFEGVISGTVQVTNLFIQFLGHMDEVIASMPPIVARFAGMTIGVLIIYFVIGIATGGDN